MFESVLHFRRCICEDKAYQYQSVQRFTEVIAQRCSVKNVFLENFAKKRGSRLQTCNFIKGETLAEVFSCEFCKISQNTFFTEHLCWLLLDLSGNTLTWNISLILTPYNSHKKLSFKIHKLTKNLFRLNIFAIYFPLKLVVFIVHLFSIRAVSLYQTKVIFAFMKKADVDHFCAFSCH